MISQECTIPDWHDIDFITRDLLSILDLMEENQDDNPPNIRVKIARAIANMRDEKAYDEVSTCAEVGFDKALYIPTPLNLMEYV